VVSSDHPSAGERPPAWPERLRAIAQQCRTTADRQHRHELLGEAWVLTRTALSQYLDWHASRLGRAPAEDLADLAAEKALDLLRRLDHGDWDLDVREPAEIRGFLSVTARNGLISLLMKLRRTVPTDDDVATAPIARPDPAAAPPDRLVQAREFAAALHACLGELNPRHRLIWCLRALCEMHTRDIARHPEVRLAPSNVDVIMQRCRARIQACLGARGYSDPDLPPGAFAACWQAFLAPDRSGRDRYLEERSG